MQGGPGRKLKKTKMKTLKEKSLSCFFVTLLLGSYIVSCSTLVRSQIPVISGRIRTGNLLHVMQLPNLSLLQPVDLGNCIQPT